MNDLPYWVFVAFGLMGAGVVKGSTGIGYASCALPILTHFIGLKPAMALILAPTFATNLSVAMSFGDVRESAVKFAPLYLAMLPGVAVGVMIFPWISASSPVFVLGLIMVSYSLISLAKPTAQLSERATHLLRLPVGFATGFLTGLTGSQVVPLVPYMLAVRMDSKQTIQSINLGVLLLTSCLGIGLFVQKLVDPAAMAMSVIAVIPALIGSEIGNRMRSRLPLPMLRGSVLIIVGLIGVKMVIWN